MPLGFSVSNTLAQLNVGSVAVPFALITTLLPAIPLNMLVAWPLQKLCRLLLRPPGVIDRVREVEIAS